MDGVGTFVATHPFWDWAGLAAALLAIEVGTATGYLLWPAASAGAVALLQFLWRPAPVVDVLIFGVLTFLTTLLARNLLPSRLRQPGPDINDRAKGLIGRSGQTVGDFSAGRGRVFVDGAEWIAETEDAAAPPAAGAKVEIVDVLGGGRLKVRAA